MIHKVKNRKWNTGKELFQEYAIDQMFLMSTLDLSIHDKINLLIRGIEERSLKAATMIQADSLETFIDRMSQVSTAVGVREKKSQFVPAKPGKPIDSSCKNCGKKGHHHRDCKEKELTCFYCKQKGHRK